MSSQPLLVELFLTNARIRGMTSQVEERRRLVDVLNTAEEAFHLDAGRVSIGSGDGRSLPNLNVEKRAIVAAIPHETPEQLRHRALLRMSVGHTPTLPTRVTVLLPPFIAEGSAHLPAGARGQRAKLHADAGLFNRFFSVTDGRLILPNGDVVDAPVMFLNRDLVAAISVAVAERELSLSL